MKKYEDLKKDTYLYLMKDTVEVKKLIAAILLISLCHDKCLINNQELLVSPKFIKKCNNLVSFQENYETFSELDDLKKFSLIRNKLAHGDFVINQENNSIIIKHNIKEKEITTSLNINSIISFAKEITNYYDYLASSKEREKIYIRNGIKMTVKDKPLRNHKRGEVYNKMYKFILEHINKFQIPFQNTINNINTKYLEFKYTYEPTNEPDQIIENPYANPLIKIFNDYLDGNNNPNQKVSDLLIKFYVIFFYPLENFLKGEDKNILSLKNQQMFNFAELDLKNAKKSNVKNNVGKVTNYQKQLTESYQKINLLMEKRNSLEVTLTKNYTAPIQQKHQELTKEIDELVDLFCTASVQTLYTYSQNRSIIEHLRCSVMHGNYTYNELTDTFEFKDLWKNQEWYHINLSFEEFKSLLNFQNTTAVINQFDNVTNKKNKKKNQKNH